MNIQSTITSPASFQSVLPGQGPDRSGKIPVVPDSVEISAAALALQEQDTIGSAESLPGQGSGHAGRGG
jgi:hypothetical protein